MATCDAPVLLEARGLAKRLGAIQAVDAVDLTVRQGEIVAIMGTSGSGKSTLLRCLDALLTPDSGTITFAGEPLPDQKRGRPRQRSAMVFQRFNLFAHLSALDNVTLGPRKLRGMSRGEAEAAGRALLTRFGVADLAGRYPAQLSGGQRQRVAIARALAMEPLVLLFDEPTSSLDPESVRDVVDAIRDLASSRQTMVIVTHDAGFARATATRTLTMRNGRLSATG